VVVDQADQPSLEMATAGELNEERAFDIDVPELIGLAALVARSRLSRQGWAGRAKTVEKSLNPSLANVSDLSPAQLCRYSLRIPVGQ